VCCALCCFGCVSVLGALVFLLALFFVFVAFVFPLGVMLCKCVGLVFVFVVVVGHDQ